MVKAYYAVTAGLAGLYIPNVHYGAHEFNTRRDLAQCLRDYIDLQEFPKSTIRTVKINRIWAFLKHHGASTAHFRIVYKQFEIAFHGLTEDEYHTMVREDREADGEHIHEGNGRIV